MNMFCQLLTLKKKRLKPLHSAFLKRISSLVRFVVSTHDNQSHKGNNTMDKMKRYKLVAETAIEVGDTWSNRDIIRFHYFNSNGLIDQKRKNDRRISTLVSSGVVPSGWSVAYGTFADFEENLIIKLSRKKTVSSIDRITALRMMREHIKKQNEKISSATTLKGN